jgi:glycosyltransferase involved in cell wall biosynthesis
VPVAAAAARRAVRRHGAAVVVSSSPPVSAHLAALAAARATGVPAILDFRDLFSAHRPEEDRSRRASRERRLERRLLASASAVVAATEGISEWLRSQAPAGSGGRFTAIRNGYEESDFGGLPPPREPGVFRLVHAGTVYGARQDTTALFRALARLRATGAFGPRRVEVLLAGKVDPQTLAAARDAGCADALRHDGFVGHAEAVRLSRAATVNLLLVWSAAGPVADTVCPGRMYEQMAAGRPILALARPGGEAARLLREAGGAIVADIGDEAAIADALRRLAAADAAGDALSAVPPRAGDLARFTRRAAAAQYAALLSSVARR